MSYDFLFRFDANDVVGAGHLQRSLSLIQPLVKRAFSIACMGDYSEQYQAILDSADLKCLKPHEYARAKCVVIDHYGNVDNLIDGLDFEHTVLFVDQGSCGHSIIDIVISPFGELEKLSALYPNALVRAGIEYLSFRSDVLNLNQARRHTPRSKKQGVKPLILVSLGGSDQRETLQRICCCLAPIAEFVQVRVMSIEPMEVPSGIELSVGYDPDFLQHALDADLVICGVGQTFLELNKLGVETVGLVLAQNQLSCAKVLSENGAVIIKSLDRLERELQKLEALFKAHKLASFTPSQTLLTNDRCSFLGEMMASKSDQLVNDIVKLII